MRPLPKTPFKPQADTRRDFVHYKRQFWLMARKCINKSEWLWSGGFWFAIVKKCNQKPSLDNQNDLFAFSHHEFSMGKPQHMVVVNDFSSSGQRPSSHENSKTVSPSSSLLSSWPWKYLDIYIEAIFLWHGPLTFAARGPLLHVSLRNPLDHDSG